MISYEQLRMEKLRRNQQVLMELGLSKLNEQTIPETKKREKIALRETKKERLAKTIPESSRRRSPRLIETINPSNNNSSKAPEATFNEDQKEMNEDDASQFNYDPSKVLTYSCFEAPSASGGEDNKSTAVNFRIVSKGVADLNLKKIYSMAFHSKRPILAAGGHLGRVSVFSSTMKDAEADEVLLSFKASKGWISGLRFVDDLNAGLLSTSNDGNLCLWDCTQEHERAPKRLFSIPLHDGNGIYDLDNIGPIIATSSKDGSLCIGQLIESNFQEIAKIEDAHAGVSKSVAFRPNQSGQVLSSCGNDSAVRVWDLRSSNIKPIMELFSPFNLAMNCVKWNPDIDYLILASSFATSMEIYDTRFPKNSSVLLTGHIPKSQTRVSNIYRPVFLSKGKYIAASGGGSKSLTVFESSSGEVISSGYMGWEAGSMQEFNGIKLAVSHGMNINFFDCFS